MKTTPNLKLTMLSALLASCFIVTANVQAESSSNDVKVCHDDMGNIKSWFPHSATPKPDDAGFTPNSICSFNAWAWQTFLWVTQEQDGMPRFLTYESPYDVLGIISREDLNPNPSGIKIFDEIAQAGPDGILVDQNGNVVYYSQYLNPEWVDFINKNDLTNPATVQGFDSNTSFPAGAVEFKASWRIVEPGEDMSGFYTMTHDVYGLKQQGSSISVDVNNVRNVELALVGLHIGGVVQGHPEMIWATFEHNANSPTVPADFVPTTVIADSGDYTFFDTQPAPSTPQLKNTYSGCNINYVVSPYMKLDSKIQKLSPITQVCLQYAHGNPAVFDLSPDSAVNEGIQETIDENNQSIIELNGIVKSQLKSEKSIWGNYHEVGSIWFNRSNGLEPGMTLATDFDSSGKQLLIGSLMLSNSTIETYTQFASAQNNCFRCHNTEQRLLGTVNGHALTSLKPMNLNISYAFSNIYTWSQLIDKQK